MSPRSHAFSTDEAPTKPAYRGARRATPTADDEVPTTLRPSGVVRTSRPTPPPLPQKRAARAQSLPPTLPRAVPLPLPSSLPPPPPLSLSHPLTPSPSPPLPRPRIRSLASILEPSEEPCVVLPARVLVLPPDPEAFSASEEKARKKRSDSTRWLLRIALVTVVLLEELLLAAPAGMLHRPHGIAEAGTMLGSAIRSSVVTALGR